jgi:5-deoxy-glucuronate isomerase
MRIRGQTPFPEGFTEILRAGERARGLPEGFATGPEGRIAMGFGILKLRKGEGFSRGRDFERAWLLMSGVLRFGWQGRGETAERNSLFDENPACLHLPSGIEASITAVSDKVEIAVVEAESPLPFEPEFHHPEECRVEERGSGTLGETATRRVRTIFDLSNSPSSALVLGEVIDPPGRWSSYPPHSHPQPEIYHYRFLPSRGFGYAELGEEVLKVREGDTVLIGAGKSHPQAAAPGYAMYYLWAIRHLPGNPYVAPEFDPEHQWTTSPGAKIWKA